MLMTQPNTVSRGRLFILTLGVFCAAGVLLRALYEVQVMQGEEHRERLRSQTTVRQLLSPARGGILDRNGIGLAENRASFDIDVNLRELIGTYARSNRGKMPETTWTQGRRIVDAALILDETTGDVVESLGLPIDYTRREILRHYYQQPNIPFRLAHGLDFETLSRFSEHSVNIPGVQETARPIRHYNFGALAPHILGYIGRFEEITQAEFVPESVGKEGVERMLDSYLQGEPGGKILRKNNLGYILGVEAVREPTVGGSVYLTIDVRIQHIVEQVMRGVGRGACVIMDPWTGDVLAMVSVPNYDPNVFVPSIQASVWQDLTTDTTRPMLNRALQGYATGSTFKTIVALAAFENPKANFTPQTHINSPPAIWHANRWWSDWYAGGRGSINLHTAMQWSTNTFFYQLGLRTGIASITEMGERVGIGSRLLVDEEGKPLLSGESPGVMPGPEWMNEREASQFASWRARRERDPTFPIPRTWRERWSDGHTLNTSIGQGFVEATPLQMTTMISAVANGGDIYSPRLIRAITRSNAGRTELVREFGVRKRAELKTRPEHMQALQRSLLAVTEGGTGRAAYVDSNFKVAGKTGTAQFTARILGSVVKDNRAWFNGYAPFEEPRYAITVMVEGGTSGGGTTGPIVREIFRRIRDMENGIGPELVYLTPAIGHYAGVSSVSDTPTELSQQPLPPQDFSEPVEIIDEMAESNGTDDTVIDRLRRRR